MSEPALQSEPQPGATILIAEDDAAVRELLVRVLRLRGYQVVEAANGLDALDVASSRGQPFELLLTDVVMPRMGGPDLAARLLRNGHTQRVIYMTGYADVLLDSREAVTVLRKPFSPATLTAAVRAALAQ